MKRLWISIIAMVLFGGSHAQNIGIGITTPRAKLHIFQGSSGNFAPFSPLVVEDDANTYVNLLSPDVNETGVLFGNNIHAARGGIIYNNASTLNGLQFRTAGNLTRMVITSDGYVGIGTTSPGAPLSFSAAEGRKITLMPGASGVAGFAVQSNTLQIHTHHINADIAFGYDLFDSFHERFSIKGNGALAVNGNSGSAGQVLQSNGTAAPSWTNPTNLLYSNTIMLQSSSATLLNSGAITALPGLSHTFTVNSNTKVLINFTISAFPPSCFACGATSVITDINLNGAIAKRYRQDISNDSDDSISGTFLISVGPGSHTISISASKFGPDIWLGHSGIASVATLQIIPQ